MTEPKEQQLILLRGMPGAGKTTFAHTLMKLGNFRHVEGDQWRGYGDKREYSKTFNDNAHAYALGFTAHLLRFARSDVVVTNTFPTLNHLRPYFALAHELNWRSVDNHNIKVTVMEMQGPLGRSVQSPRGKGCNATENIQAYLDQWEPYRGEFNDTV